MQPRLGAVWCPIRVSLMVPLTVSLMVPDTCSRYLRGPELAGTTLEIVIPFDTLRVFDFRHLSGHHGLN